MKPSESKEKFFSLVILCYRAEEAIIPFVRKVHEALSCYSFSWEIVLVANYMPGVPDRTPAIVKELSTQLSGIRCVSEPKEGMMGWDLRKGLDSAEGEYIAMVDGDGQFPIESVFSCLTRIVIDRLDLVKTYRVDRHDGFYRLLVSRIYNLVFQLLFGAFLRDANSKPKVFKRSVYRQMELKSSDWFIDAEIMIRAKELGLKIAEIPICFYAHEDRASFVKPSAIFEFIRNLFIAYRKHRKAMSGGARQPGVLPK